MYKLDLSNNNYIPQTQKKYFKIALEYVLKNNQNNVIVNRCKFFFDFKKMIVKIGSSFDGYELATYKLIEV